jgi:hypothetical protein
MGEAEAGVKPFELVKLSDIKPCRRCLKGSARINEERCVLCDDCDEVATYIVARPWILQPVTLRAQCPAPDPDQDGYSIRLRGGKLDTDWLHHLSGKLGYTCEGCGKPSHVLADLMHWLGHDGVNAIEAHIECPATR